jgi:putative membrane protein
MKNFLLSIPILALCAGVTGFAADTSDKQGNLSAGDMQFVRDAAHGGATEVEFGKILQQRAQSTELKKYGERLVEDHSKANDKLARIVEKKGVRVPTEPDSDQQTQLQRLSAMSGQQFDEHARQIAIRDHQGDIEKFRRASENAQDPELRQFAKDTLPVLERHLRMAQDIRLTTSTTPR